MKYAVVIRYFRLTFIGNPSLTPRWLWQVAAYRNLVVNEGCKNESDYNINVICYYITVVIREIKIDKRVVNIHEHFNS